MENRIKTMIKGCIILAIFFNSQFLRGQDVQAKADTLSFFEKIPIFNKDVYVMKATDFPYNGTAFYRNKKWLAVNPGKHKEASIETTFPYPAGKYDIIFSGVGEYDGNSEYFLFLNGKQVLQFIVPPSNYSNEEGVKFSKLISNIAISKGDVINVSAKVGTDGKEFSRGRWGGVVFTKTGTGAKLLNDMAGVEYHVNIRKKK